MSLPPLSLSPSLAALTHEPPPTFRPVATKADKYAKLVKIDHLRVQRPTAHFRNALKTTAGLELVTTQLDKVSSTPSAHGNMVKRLS